MVVAEMLDEYRLGYAKARPYRFSDRMDKNVVVVALDPDVAEVFDTPETVNKVLRALIGAMPNIARFQPDEKSTA
jgi:hypothetical protein